MMETKTSSNDRRSSNRFPILSEVRYHGRKGKDSESAGTGQIINISSTGVLFTTEHQLLTGQPLELLMNWPAKLDGNCKLRLRVRGKVVWATHGAAAMSIEKHEFRTRGTLL